MCRLMASTRPRLITDLHVRDNRHSFKSGSVRISPAWHTESGPSCVAAFSKIPSLPPSLARSLSLSLSRSLARSLSLSLSSLSRARARSRGGNGETNAERHKDAGQCRATRLGQEQLQSLMVVVGGCRLHSEFYRNATQVHIDSTGAAFAQKHWLKHELVEAYTAKILCL